MRKIIQRLGIVILSLTAFLTIGYLTPRKWGNYSQADCTISLYISNQGIHTEIIVPVKNKYFDWDNTDCFYEAKDSYSILRTCNDWTAEALQKADVNTPLWSTLSSAIMFHLNSGCKCQE